MKKLICILFHRIVIIQTHCFTDKVTGRRVEKFECKRCGIKYLANKANDWSRVIISN